MDEVKQEQKNRFSMLALSELLWAMREARNRLLVLVNVFYGFPELLRIFSIEFMKVAQLEFS